MASKVIQQPLLLGIKEAHVRCENPQIFIIIFWGLQQGLMRDLLLLLVDNRRWWVRLSLNLRQRLQFGG
jgi:hypothetical protein